MAKTHATVVLDRDCVTTVIPSGQSMLLGRGETVVVTQTLGGSATVQTERGYLVRVNAEDSLALGLVAEGARPAPTDAAAPFDLDQVIAQLKDVFDPEIPINVVDLGLIYRCEAIPQPNGFFRIEIDMSMTAPGCGMGDVLRRDARAAVETVPGVTQADVELVYDPPWGLDRISDAARLQLGLL